MHGEDNGILRVAHVAAFHGNLGDRANHVAFYSWFRSFFPNTHIVWTKIDLREVWRTDRDLLRRITNLRVRPDLLVFGGGNFWETWDTSSKSGTSLNVTRAELEKLGIPIFFNALGFETNRGISKNAEAQFFPDLQKYLEDSHVFVSIRNDGSSENLERVGINTQGIHKLPDHAFFLEVESNTASDQEIPQIAINLASDMPGKRYPKFGNTADFITAMADCFAEVFSVHPFNLRFVAHIPSDLDSGVMLMSKIPERMQRENFSLDFRNYGGLDNLDFVDPYWKSEVNIVQRFHANILSLISPTKTLGISNLPKVTDLLQEVSANPGSVLPLNGPDDMSKLCEELILLLSMRPLANQREYDHSALLKVRKATSMELDKWLLENGLK